MCTERENGITRTSEDAGRIDTDGKGGVVERNCLAVTQNERQAGREIRDIESNKADIPKTLHHTH